MKKVKKLLICLVVLFSFSSFVNATCKNEELNDWATKVEPKFIEVKEEYLDSSNYAYLLSITPLRDDIVIKVTDGNGDSANGKMLHPSSNEDAIQAVGCYLNLEEETYTIEVYGSKGSACPNELLKSMKYTVPRYNRFLKDARCEDSDSELCKAFTNSTKDMTQEEFDKALDGDTGKSDGSNLLSRIMSFILNYALYVIIPLIVVAIFYGIKINKYKREERDR